MNKNVITFLDSKSCSVVLQSWLVKNPVSIVGRKWPKHKVTNNMVMKYQTPSEDWLEYDVKIIGLSYGKKKVLYFNYYMYKIQLLFNLLARKLY